MLSTAGKTKITQERDAGTIHFIIQLYAIVTNENTEHEFNQTRWSKHSAKTREGEPHAVGLKPPLSAASQHTISHDWGM